MLAPSDAAILERARSLCSQACYTIALQHRRLRSTEPEDEKFLLRWWADLQFLIVALRRLRRSAELAVRVATASGAVTAAIRQFDDALPDLAKMRNVGEHVDDYAVDHPKRRHRDVYRTQLQVGTWNGVVFEWLGATLDIDVSLDAAGKLFDSICKAIDRSGSTS